MIDTDRAGQVVVNAGDSETFTGSALIEAAVAGNVAKVHTKISKRE